MQPVRIVFTLWTVAFLWACHDATQTEKTKETPTKDSIYTDTTDITTDKISVKNTASNEGLEDTVTDIKFEDISISINRLVVFDENSKLAETQKDTVYLYSELGETIEGQLISIAGSQLSNLTVEQRYETSVTIMDEGPHCDLVDWKHYESEWKRLKTNNKGQFICDSYSEKELEKFPAIQINELKEYVQEHCGKGWLELITTIKSPIDYPSGVGVSRYFLRLTGQRKDSKEIVKVIVFEIAMGC